jgi:hypothetical protein
MTASIGNSPRRKDQSRVILKLAHNLEQKPTFPFFQDPPCRCFIIADTAQIAFGLLSLRHLHALLEGALPSTVYGTYFSGSEGNLPRQTIPKSITGSLKYLETALHLAKELNDLTTSHFIERALAGARARQLRPPTVA